MFVSDLRHFIGISADAAGPARRMAEQLGYVVRAATAAEPGDAWVSTLPCRRRPGHRPCAGRITVRRADNAGPIGWECNSCGDAGRISGWEHSASDLRVEQQCSKVALQQVRVSADVAETLRDITFTDPERERVVYRAYPAGDDVVLTATAGEIVELTASVSAEAEREPNRRRRQRLQDAAIALVEQTRPADEPHPADVRDLQEPKPPVSAAIPLPDLDVARVRRWCAARVPARARQQVRVECEIAERHLTIVERRIPWSEDLGPEWTSSPIAQLRYSRSTRIWKLYRSDRNIRFRVYDPMPSSARIDELLTEIGTDPHHLFWG